MCCFRTALHFQVVELLPRENSRVRHIQADEVGSGEAPCVGRGGREGRNSRSSSLPARAGGAKPICVAGCRTDASLASTAPRSRSARSPATPHSPVQSEIQTLRAPRTISADSQSW